VAKSGGDCADRSVRYLPSFSSRSNLTIPTALSISRCSRTRPTRARRCPISSSMAPPGRFSWHCRWCSRGPGCPLWNPVC
jgi:hypothetical protein